MDAAITPKIIQTPLVNEPSTSRTTRRILFGMKITDIASKTNGEITKTEQHLSFPRLGLQINFEPNLKKSNILYDFEGAVSRPVKFNSISFPLAFDLGGGIFGKNPFFEFLNHFFKSFLTQCFNNM
jgi:hypothetical protein